MEGNMTADRGFQSEIFCWPGELCEEQNRFNFENSYVTTAESCLFLPHTVCMSIQSIRRQRGSFFTSVHVNVPVTVTFKCSGKNEDVSYRT
jgi:hypothetical protein